MHQCIIQFTNYACAKILAEATGEFYHMPLEMSKNTVHKVVQSENWFLCQFINSTDIYRVPRIFQALS